MTEADQSAGAGRLKTIRSYLAEAEKHAEDNRLYIEDLRLSIDLLAPPDLQKAAAVAKAKRMKA